MEMSAFWGKSPGNVHVLVVAEHIANSRFELTLGFFLCTWNGIRGHRIFFLSVWDCLSVTLWQKTLTLAITFDLLSLTMTIKLKISNFGHVHTRFYPLATALEGI